MVNNKYGLEPEEWADLKTNFPEYYKNIVIENQQSGGSSGGSSNTMFVKLIKNDSTNELSCETSVADIYNAWEEGKFVYLRVFKYYPDTPEEYKEYEYEADENEPCYTLQSAYAEISEDDLPDPSLGAGVRFEYVSRNSIKEFGGNYTPGTGDVWTIPAN